MLPKPAEATVESQQHLIDHLDGQIHTLLRENERLKKALRPFSDMAGELFMRNWNAGDVVTALDNPDDPHRITAGDYFAARLALKA